MKSKSIISKFIVLALLLSNALAFAETTPLPFDENILTTYSWGTTPGNSASINLLPAWKNFKLKKDVVVAIIDTGIDNTHPFIAKNLYVKEGTLSDSNFGMDFSGKGVSKSPVDTHGHGSHIAGIIKSVYPDVKILSLKYFNPSASGQENINSTVRAIKYAIDSNVDIINYSAGGDGAASEELAVLKEAERKGIMVVAAAGNKSANIDIKGKGFFPASYNLENIMTVTAYDEDLKLLDSSNFGAHSVDISAPGHRIKSSLNNGRVGFLTGTSQATAFVTGVASMIKAKYPHLSMMKIKSIIKRSAHKEETLVGKCNTNGRLDAGAALVLAEQEANSVDGRGIAYTP